MLLEKGKKVIFEPRKDKIVYSFIPDENKKYIVNMMKIKDFDPQFCDILKDSNSFYLIDPDKPEQIVNVAAHTILVASPNREHYKEYSKRPYLSIFCMSSWEKEDAKLLINYISINNKYLNENEFNMRYYKFGGILRHIFTDNLKKYEDNIKSALNRLNFEDLIRSFLPTELDQQNSNISSYIFKYHVNKIDPDYKYLKTADNVETVISSDYIKLQLALKYGREIMINVLNPYSKKYENRTGVYEFFELFSKILIQIGGSFKIKELYSKNKEESKLILKESEIIVSNSEKWELYFKECKDLQSLNNDKRKLILPKITNIPIIDFMDSNNQGFQVTLSKEHSIKFGNLENDFGLLKIMKILSINELKIYYIIPEWNFNDFKLNFEDKIQTLKNFKNFSDDFKKDDMIIDLLNNKNIKLYILSIDENHFSGKNSDSLIKILQKFEK